MSRKVIFIRGPQGAGKTTMVRRAGLEGFHISMDKIRDILAGDMLNPNGQFIPSHENEALAFQILDESLNRRIARGEVICVDGTLADGAQLYDRWKKFDAAGYKGLVVDLYGFDEALRNERNTSRQERHRVPEDSIRKMQAMAGKSPIPPIMRDNPKITMINPTSDEDVTAGIRKMQDFLRDPRCTRDLSAYERVIHIGDIQGCYAPLMDPASPLKDGLDPNAFYVFMGDLFDRGIQNGEVGRWFMDEIYGKPNVALIAGNHEDYVEMQARAGDADIDMPNSEWVRFSWPQLKAVGITPQDCGRIAEMSQDYLAYKWDNQKVLCSHAGFARWPSNMNLISTHQMRRGNGRYSIDVDAAWSKTHAGSDRYQVHGHRNSEMKPTITSPLSINLEAQVEFGGHLRIATLDVSGFTPTDIRSTVHRRMQDDVAVNRAVKRTAASRHAPLMPWVERDEALPKISQEMLDKMRDHNMINLRDSESFPGVYSVNFTHKAFNDAAWDDYTTVARGLYIDGEARTVVARSYEKFFNLNERPETQESSLAKNVNFPVHAYEKANGFLGITGYSERHGKLVIASKSVTDGTFPGIARDVIEDAIGPDGMERMLRFNRDQQASLVFEIEDPERDPHIIKLDKPRIVLLGCVRRSELFEQAPYEDLQAVAKWLGCEVKQRIAVLPNEKALASFNHRVERDPKWQWKGAPIEGCVMEDSKGFFYKLKSHYYRNWKRMRSAVNHIRKAKLTDREPGMGRYADLGAPFEEFLDWAKTLPVAALEHDIVALRSAFEGDRSVMENIRDTRMEEQAAARAAGLAEHFAGLVDQIADNRKITPHGIKGFIASAMGDPLKAEILKSHERYEELKARAEPEDAESVPGF